MPLRRRAPAPVVRSAPPALEPGARVRLKTTGSRATVMHVKGRSVVLEMDEPFTAAGITQRTYYSYPGELEAIAVAGRMGAQVLYAEEAGDLPDA